MRRRNRELRPTSAIDPAQRNVALLVAGCFFMEMLDGTIVTTSAPKIAHSLNTSIGSIALVITAYLVTLAVLIPLSGWVAARVGARTTFLAAIAIFTLASVGCAASSTLGELVVMRVFQGAGGAMMVPVGRLVVLSRSDTSNLMRLTALLVWPGLLAPVFAPLVGGLITTYASWHWLFLINLPLGVLAFVIAFRIVHPTPLADPGPLDVLGLILTSIGLGGLTFTANLLARSPTNWTLVAAIAIPAAVLLALDARHLLKVSAPLVDLQLLRIDTFRSALAGTGLYFMVVNAVPFLAPLLFEEVFHWSAIKAGAVVLFIFAGNVCSKFLTTYLYSRFGFKAVLIASTMVMALSLILLGVVGAGAPIVVIVVILLMNGSSRSIGATGYTTVVFTDVPQEDMRHANTLQLTVQQLGSGMGVAAGAIALRLGKPVGDIFSSHVGAHAVYTVAFALVASLSLLATLEAARMRTGSGDALLGNRAPTPTPATASD
jgi:EmrB/QacA subfamily drug resistance transporter